MSAGECTTCGRARPWPESRADYPARWRPIASHPEVHRAPWTPEDDEVLYCPDCGRIWSLWYDQRELLLVAEQVPPSLLPLMGAPGAVELLCRRRFDIESDRGAVRMWRRLAERRLPHGDLQHSAASLVRLLSREDVTAGIAADLGWALIHVIWAAREIVYADVADLGPTSPVREALVRRFRERRRQGGEGLLESAFGAVADREAARDLFTLPPIRLGDLEPVFALRARLAGAADQPANALDHRRTFDRHLTELERLAALPRPVVVVDERSRARLAQIGARELRRKECVDELRRLAALDALSVDHLGRASARARELERELTEGELLSRDEALILVDLHERIAETECKPDPGAVTRAKRSIEALLKTMPPTDAMPARLRRILSWNLRHSAASRDDDQ